MTKLEEKLLVLNELLLPMRLNEYSEFLSNGATTMVGLTDGFMFTVGMSIPLGAPMPIPCGPLL
jgi:hypothetical protein